MKEPAMQSTAPVSSGTPSASGRTARAPREALLSMSGIAKVFHTDEVETHALADVHLDVGKGEFVSISGPSGSGKSTLLSILGLLDAPSRGDYKLGGENASGLDPDRRAQLRNRTIGFIFQAFVRWRRPGHR
jgi:putative ABC transport system ATP-binding protein